MAHQGAAPNFKIRAVSFHRSALSRQIGEAVRIMRRGGEGVIFNSKSEYDRCKIPRLQVEEQKEEEWTVEEQQDLEQALNEIEEQSRLWSSKKYEERKKDERASWSMESRSNVREPDYQEGGEGRSSKRRRKFVIMEENWGEQEYEKAREQTLASPTPPPPPTVKEQEEQLLQLPYYSREPEITLPTVSPSKREQQVVEGVPTKEPTPTEEKEQAPSHYHQPPREEQMGERPHSQQAGMVDNNVNPTLPQSREVVVECSIEEGMSTYMEIGDEDGLDTADGI